MISLLTSKTRSPLSSLVLLSLLAPTLSFTSSSFGVRLQGAEKLRVQVSPRSSLGVRVGRTGFRSQAGGSGVLGLRAEEEEGLRSATSEDADLISKMVKAEKMNPLFLDTENFVVAESDGEVIGIGQIRNNNGYYELASLVVEKECRGQGVGTAIVAELLERHKAKFEKEEVPAVLLLTLKGTTKFYAQLGFLELPISMAPMALQMEAGAGGLVSKMVTGQDLVAMKYSFQSSVELSCEKSGTILKKVTKDK